MTYRYRIACYKPTTSSVFRYVEGAYSYHGDRPLRWAQRLCLWVLRRLGCHHYYPEDSFDFIEVSAGDVYGLVKEVLPAIDRIYGAYMLRPKYLLVGREAMDRLAWQTDAFLWWAPEELRDRRMGRFPSEVCGLKVVLVPWMEGVLLLPDLERVTGPPALAYTIPCREGGETLKLESAER